jgi:hypothetical protein
MASDHRARRRYRTDEDDRSGVGWWTATTRTRDQGHRIDSSGADQRPHHGQHVHQRLVIDARAAGLAIGAILLWFRAPAVLAMLVAAIVCALLRLAT